MTKVCLVFDAAVKHDGERLNDTIWPGPKLERELVDVLTRFRWAPVALSVDISEMFLQVELQDKDRPFHRFLWRNLDTSREPDVYEFQPLLFGNTAAPFCSQYVLQTNAKAHALEFPETASTVEELMYVDDVLDSFEDVKSAQHLRHQLSAPLAMADFKCCFLVRGENRSNWRKNSRSKGENQQQTQPTCQHRGRIGGRRVFSPLRHPWAFFTGCWGIWSSASDLTGEVLLSKMLKCSCQSLLSPSWSLIRVVPSDDSSGSSLKWWGQTQSSGS